MDKIILIIFLILLIGCTAPENQVCFEDNCFEVELAITQNEHNKGLMYREHLDKDKGMLFIFEQPDDYGFWMKNTLVPLDIIWIDENREVIFISKDTQPCEEDPCPSVNPGKPAKYVLELNAGTADEIGLAEGDLLIINAG
ncbi:DUF192 domain-containing protein [Candidatus Woesearchaeota archaeon]|nr:DUF192 domain-containing protein [Candidatus Woesearchaeota archaeon]